MPSFRSGVRAAAPGLAVAAVVGIAATFLSLQYKTSPMLFALLLGMALNFLAEEGKCLPGIRFASSAVLRTGVALLGLRITLSQVQGLGWGVVLLVVVTVALTIGAGLLFSRWLRLSSSFGILTGGAVAICGASAALAIASLLPRHPHAERDASFTVIGVTALSTIAMIVYPMVGALFHLDHGSLGVFLGATIHDVAQVVGAGYGVSLQTGDTATIVKLLRVAMLLPVCFLIGLSLRVRPEAAGRSAPLLPWFVVGFAALVLIGSAGWISVPVVEAGSTLSRWCLVTAIAAIGMKTSLKSLVDMGPRPVVLIVLETLLLAGVVLAVVAVPILRG
jgi:uncharacterized integral membrane protein (TIGR00698 family)